MSTFLNSILIFNITQAGLCANMFHYLIIWQCFIRCKATKFNLHGPQLYFLYFCWIFLSYFNVLSGKKWWWGVLCWYKAQTMHLIQRCHNLLLLIFVFVSFSAGCRMFTSFSSSLFLSLFLSVTPSANNKNVIVKPYPKCYVMCMFSSIIILLLKNKLLSLFLFLIWEHLQI